MLIKSLGAIIASATFLFIGFVAGPASALSCMKPSIEMSYNGWADAKDRYFIATGKLTPLSPLPKVPNAGQLSANPGAKPDLRAVYRFEGELIGIEDNTPLNHVVWVKVDCAGPWCGNFPKTSKASVFAFKHMPDYTLEASFGPCGGNIFEDTSGAIEKQVKSCMVEGRCEDVRPQRGG